MKRQEKSGGGRTARVVQAVAARKGVRENNLQFLDNRPAIVVQRKWRKAVWGGPLTERLSALRKVDDRCTQFDEGAQMHASGRSRPAARRAIRRNESGFGVRRSGGSIQRMDGTPKKNKPSGPNYLKWLTAARASEGCEIVLRGYMRDWALEKGDLGFATGGAGGVMLGVEGRDCIAKIGPYDAMKREWKVNLSVGVIDNVLCAFDAGEVIVQGGVDMPKVKVGGLIMRRLRSDDSKLTPLVVCNTARKMWKAMKEFWSRGLRHGDMKADQWVWDEELPTLLDFGRTTRVRHVDLETGNGEMDETKRAIADVLFARADTSRDKVEAMVENARNSA